MSTLFMFDVGDTVRITMYPGDSHIVQLNKKTVKTCLVGNMRTSCGRKEYLVLVRWEIKKPTTPNYTHDEEGIWMDENRVAGLSVNTIPKDNLGESRVSRNKRKPTIEEIILHEPK